MGTERRLGWKRRSAMKPSTGARAVRQRVAEKKSVKKGIFEEKEE
jgi:hypothetical protein